jgi:hypothetical protein
LLLFKQPQTNRFAFASHTSTRVVYSIGCIAFRATAAATKYFLLCSFSRLSSFAEIQNITCHLSIAVVIFGRKHVTDLDRNLDVDAVRGVNLLSENDRGTRA